MKTSSNGMRQVAWSLSPVFVRRNPSAIPSSRSKIRRHLSGGTLTSSTFGRTSSVRLQSPTSPAYCAKRMRWTPRLQNPGRASPMRASCSASATVNDDAVGSGPIESSSCSSTLIDVPGPATVAASVEGGVDRFKRCYCPQLRLRRFVPVARFVNILARDSEQLPATASDAAHERRFAGSVG